jgi:hypothetical protein
MFTEVQSDDRGRGQNPVFAVTDCKARNEAALKRYPDFFNSQVMADIQAEICKLYIEFFGRRNCHTNYRGGTKKPFTVMKIDDVGGILNRKRATKQSGLTNKLEAIAAKYGRVLEGVSKDGHYSVRIY